MFFLFLFHLLVSFKLTCLCCSYPNVAASFDDAMQKRMQIARRKNGPVLPQCVPDVADICNRFDEYGLVISPNYYSSKLLIIYPTLLQSNS